jgi:hypothetical protein
MTQATLELLLAHFTDKKELIDGGYYRIRDKGDGVFDLTYFTPSLCATENYHPQISFIMEDGKSVAQTLLDFECTPARRLTRDADNGAALDAELDALAEKFLSIRK